MAILTQTAFASKLGDFLNGVGPLMSKIGGITICYDLYHCGAGNVFLIQNLPNLISVPELTSTDVNYLRAVEDSYLAKADWHNSQGSEIPKPKRPANRDEYLPEPYSLHEQLMLIQDSVNQSVHEAWTLICAVGKIDYVQPVLQKRAERFREQALGMNDEPVQAAHWILRASALLASVKMYYDTLDLFKESVDIFGRSHLYSSAAVLSELAAMICELIIPNIMDEDILDWAIEEAKKNRSRAAMYWRRSIEHFNWADGENNFIDGVKLLRGLVNGLLGETDLSDVTVDWFLGMASMWHYQEEEFISQANDLMYLAFRQVSRNEALTCEIWIRVAEIIERAYLIWKKERIAYNFDQNVKSLIASAMNFASMC